MARIRRAFEGVRHLPGRWFWPGLWALVFAASFWQYRPQLDAGLEEYDPSVHDHRDTYRVVVLAAHKPLWDYVTGPFDPVGAWYRPGSSLYFSLNRRLAEADPFRWRLIALAWHAAAATLLGLLVALCAGRRAPGVLAAAWFAWRGTHFQVICWIGTNPDLVVASLSLACVIVLWRVRWRYRWRLLGAAALLAAALFTKETAAFLPPFLAATVWLWPVPDRPKLRALALVALGAVSLAYLGAYFLAVGNPAGLANAPGLPPLPACWRAYTRALWPPAHSLLLFLPSLSLGWMLLLTDTIWKLIFQQFAYYAGAALLLWRARHATLIFALWLIISPLPTFRCLLLGDRHMYLLSMGWAALAGLLIWQVGLALLCAAQARFTKA